MNVETRSPAKGYDFNSIETKWRAYWEDHKTFRAPGPGDPGFDAQKPKSYILDMFPYPSGKGLHVGHPLGYIASDIVSRFRRMRGFNVLHPMGYDAFGLPAEQYAIETGTHPRVTTEANIVTFRRQLKALALSYDWDREVTTIDPEYYRWTQWNFLQLFNSWFDPVQKKARPIRELLADLESDRARPVMKTGRIVRASEPATGIVPRFEDLPTWTSLDRAAQSNVLNHHRLAFVDEVPVNWCPMLGTVLANEEVTSDGRSERGNFPVYRRPLKQWMLRITAYADRLLEDLNTIDWSDSLKQLQRNWIGRSEGARVRFPVVTPVESPVGIEIFTTRPDTLFGATYLVLAPEHPVVERITTPEQRPAVELYRVAASRKSELDRQTDTKKKDGVFTGASAINPCTGEPIPIWIADYVLIGYGTGAIMAVPAHDTRDFEFAKVFDLPIRPVMIPDDEWLLPPAVAEERLAVDHGRPVDVRDEEGQRTLLETIRIDYLSDPSTFAEAFTGYGAAIHSHNDEVSLNGLRGSESKRTIVAWLERKGLGSGEVQYKLRDWLFSRQRYWGEPFPILHGEDGEIVAVDESELPVELPPMDDFRPTGTEDPDAPPQPTLSRAPQSWKTVVRNGRTYHRELNTMPQWAGSCWYYLRYLDPHNRERMVDPAKERYFMAPQGVDLYVGGVEHGVLHLLYARFWHKVLFDLGHVSTHEPFGTLFNQGYIQAYAYQDERGMYVEADEVVEDPAGTFTHAGESVTRTLGKMGKSLKNSVSPDETLARYGCDTLRLYEMYLGPVDASKIWNTHAIVGVHRFLHRVWRNLVDEDSGEMRVTEEPADTELRRLTHRTIAAVTQDMNEFGFNTAIARLIELNNALVQRPNVPREVAEPLVLMLAPQAPHIAEELWERLGHEPSVAYAAWPAYDQSCLVRDEMEVVVQVLGKKRGSVRVPADATEDQIRDAALADESIAKHLEGKTISKVIYVPGKLLNLVAG